MEFKFEKAEILEGTNDMVVSIRTKKNNVVKEYVSNLKDRKYTCVLKEYQEKRSLDANAYAWVIFDKVADVLGSTKEEVYREAVKDVGVFEIVPVRKDALEQWKANWESGGLGRICEVMGDSTLDGYVKTINYFGSSVYNTKQMSRLIDYIVNEAKELGIETLSPNELERMKNDWRNR